MKKEKSMHKLSANEINRYVYCPYQWYYGRHYGQTALKAQYKALGSKKGKTLSNFQKGVKFHKNYYRRYRIKRWLLGITLGIIMIVLIGSLMKWFS